MEQDRVQLWMLPKMRWSLSTATVSKVIFRTWLDSPKIFSLFPILGITFFCKILYTVIHRAMPSFIMFCGDYIIL